MPYKYSIMLVKYIESVPEFNQLSVEILDLISKVPTKENQISCQSNIKDSDEWHATVGSIKLLDQQDETVYWQINPSLKGSVIEKTINRYQGFRCRIMIMDARKCYSIHADPTPRIHIPIVTNEQCWMVWPYDNYSQHLVEGRTFWTDTTKRHTAFNAHDTESRIHLVMCVKPESVF